MCSFQGSTRRPWYNATDARRQGSRLGTSHGRSIACNDARHEQDSEHERCTSCCCRLLLFDGAHDSAFFNSSRGSRTPVRGLRTSARAHRGRQPRRSTSPPPVGRGQSLGSQSPRVACICTSMECTGCMPRGFVPTKTRSCAESRGSTEFLYRSERTRADASGLARGRKGARSARDVWLTPCHDRRTNYVK